MKIIKTIILLFTILITTYSQNDSEEVELANNRISFEHIGINVGDPEQAAKWYVKNLAMKILRESAYPSYSAFVSDSAEHMMIEFNHNNDFPTVDQLNFNYDSFHLAFHVNDIYKVKEKLVESGALVLRDIYKTDSGDHVLVLKDPWGLPIQFVQRIKPMIDINGIFIEHIAFNVKDSYTKSKWYLKNLNFTIMREGKAPSYGMFIADQNKNVMFEFYQHSDSPIIDLNNLHHGSLHIAFSVHDLKSLKVNLLKNNAVLVTDIYETSTGDSVMNMRDINGLPLQFVHRINLMIKEE